MEILVVTSIIALISAIGLANYSTVSKKSRDGKRKADLEQIRAALELYRTDEGEYPGTLDTIRCDQALEGPGGNVYMDPIPCDPKNDATYQYTYARSDPVSYTLRATMEIDESGGTCGDELAYCVKQP